MKQKNTQNSNVQMAQLVKSLCSYLCDCIKSSPASATGEDGFEGLIAIILEELTGSSFHVAGSGLQDFGDALSHNRQISLQSKAYFGEKQPTVNSIIGDVESQLHANTNLDVLVIALREMTAQKSAKLSQILDSHGLDFIYIQCTAMNPELIALLYTYWNRVSSHPLVLKMSSILKSDISNVFLAQDDYAPSIIRTLKGRLGHGDGTYCTSISKAKVYLSHRFGMKDDMPKRVLFPVCLTAAIPRNDSAQGFRKWWHGVNPVLIAEGEEGCGKSWLLAQEVWKIADTGDALVFWLDSIDWEGLNTIEEVVKKAFRQCLGINDSDKELCNRLYRKLESRWDKPILLVLDGLNERTCQANAERIIASCLGFKPSESSNTTEGKFEKETSWRLPINFRIVFSTRLTPKKFLSIAPEVTSTYKVLPYSDEEFVAILSLNNLCHNDLPKDASAILRYPRLFSVFLRIRGHIPDTATITPAVIWWYDLVAKIEAELDPAITKGLKLKSQNDAEELLTCIAKELRDDSTLSIEQLNLLLGGNYLEVRDELISSRLFKEPSRLSATVSNDHVALAWGLLILRIIQTSSTQDIVNLAEEIHKLLEPGLSDPRRSLGILIALQLSLTDGQKLPDHAVAAALLAWFSSHNIYNQEHQLDFWCQYRLYAYTLFIENLLCYRRVSSSEKVAVAPIAKLWRDSSDLADSLKPILRKWLLVTWSSQAPNNVTSCKWNDIKLPVVSQQEQLRLTPIALSILSQRFDDSMLPDIAECIASAFQSTDIRGANQFPCKWPHEAIYTLLRWSYSEDCLKSIEALHSREDREHIKEAYKGLITNGLGIRERGDSEGDNTYVAVESSIRTHHDPRVGFTNKSAWAYHIDVLAVRDDLPDLNDDAKSEIEYLFKSSCDINTPNIDRLYFGKLWPWVIKFSPAIFEEACANIVVKSLTGTSLSKYELLHHFEAFLWQHQIARILDAIDVFIKNHCDRFQYGTCDILLEWLLLNGDDTSLCNYLAATENLRMSRGYLFVEMMSTTKLLQVLKPKCVMTLASKHILGLCQAPDWKEDQKTLERVEYWLSLWSNATDEDMDALEWATRILTNDCPEGIRKNSIRLLAHSSTDRLPDLLQNNKDLFDKLSDEDIVYLLIYGNLPDSANIKIGGLWLNRGPKLIIHLGRLYHHHGDADAFSNWGKQILNLACHCAEANEGGGLATATRFELGADGKLRFTGPTYINSKPNFSLVGYSSWGIDETDHVVQKNDPESLISEWLASEENLRRWEGFAFRDFSDAYVLREWAACHSSLFKTYCDRFFNSALVSADVINKFGAFPFYLLVALLSYYPADAYSYWQRFIRISNNRVTSHGGADFVTSMAWQPDLSTIEEINVIRRESLLQAQNDEEIMGVTISALQHGTDSPLLRICEGLLASNLAKERALAVSVLAWVCQAPVVAILQDLVSGDKNSWIRKHASWALAVNLQDSACRRAYRQILLSNDEYDIARSLQIMKPALLPSCVVWRQIEEQDAAFPSKGSSPRKTAVINQFWHHWDCVTNHSNNTEVLGRRIKEHLRGHKINQQTEGQMAPWWVP